MCRVQQFCFCGTLRSAAITGAILNVLCIINLIVSGYYKLSNGSKGDGKGGGGNENRIMGIILIILAVVAIIILIFLILGIRRNHPGYFVPWLIAALIIIIAGIVNPIVLFIAGYHWLDLLFGFILSLFWLYVWICVFSYYKELKSGVTSYHP